MCACVNVRSVLPAIVKSYCFKLITDDDDDDDDDNHCP